MKSLEPDLARAECLADTRCCVNKQVLSSPLFYRWGSEKRSDLSKGVGLGRGRAQDLNPSPLTPQHGL